MEHCQGWNLHFLVVVIEPSWFINYKKCPLINQEKNLSISFKRTGNAKFLLRHMEVCFTPFSRTIQTSSHFILLPLFLLRFLLHLPPLSPVLLLLLYFYISEIPEGSYLLSIWTAVTKHRRLDGLQTTEIISYSSGFGKSKIRATADAVSSKGSPA